MEAKVVLAVVAMEEEDMVVEDVEEVAMEVDSNKVAVEDSNKEVEDMEGAAREVVDIHKAGEESVEVYLEAAQLTPQVTDTNNKSQNRFS